MNIYRAETLLQLASIGLVVTALTACRAGFTTSENTINDPDFWRFTGAGSNWRLEMERNGDGFELTRSNNPGSSVTITLSGTYEQFTNNGFTLLSVNDQNGTSDANSEIVLVRSGSFAAFLGPIFPPNTSNNTSNNSGAEAILPMVAVAACGGRTSSNWVRYKHPQNNQADAEEPYQFGTLAFDIDAETLTLTSRYRLEEPTLALSATNLDTGQCEDGYIDEPLENTHYRGADESAVLDLFNINDNQNQRLFAMDITTLSAASDFDGDSYGLLNDRGASNGRNFPIRADCVSGTCSITRIIDVEDGTVASTDNYTLQLNDVNTPRSGFITGEIRLPEQQTGQNAVCMLRLNTIGDDILACVAQSPVDNNQMLNLFLVL